MLAYDMKNVEAVGILIDDILAAVEAAHAGHLADQRLREPRPGIEPAEPAK